MTILSGILFLAGAVFLVAALFMGHMAAFAPAALCFFAATMATFKRRNGE